MSKTKKQLAANRRRTKGQTGPVTAEGKRRSSRNATKHGLYSKDTIINCSAFREDPEKYDRLLGNFKKQFSPGTPLESALVTRLSDSFWRLLRLTEVNRLSDSQPTTDSGDLPRSDFGLRPIPLPVHRNNIELKKAASRINREMLVIHKILKHLKQPEDNPKPSVAQNE